MAHHHRQTAAMAERSQAAPGGTGKSRSLRDTLKRYVIGQFMKPHGFMGRLAGWIMAARGSNRQRNRWTVDLMDLAPSDRVLEIGHGPGFALALVCARLTDGEATGIDHSQTMHDMAVSRNREAVRSGKLHFAVGHVEGLAAARNPMLTRPFDHIFAVNVAMFWQEPVRMFAVLRSLLRPGGRLYITYQPRVGKRTDEAALESARRIQDHMLAAGFTNIRINTLDTVRPMAMCVIGIRG